MKITSLAASLLALSLFALPALAQETNSAAAPVQLAQASTEVPADVQTLLQDKRPAADLSEAELKQRLRKARGFIKAGNLSQDVQKSLRVLARQSRTELNSRGQGGAKQQTESDSGTQSSTDTTAADETGNDVTEPDQQAETTTAAEPATQTSDDATSFLEDTRPASALSDTELRQRFRKARALMKSGNLSADARRSVQKIARQARLELAARSQGGKQQQAGQSTDTASGDQSQSGGEQPAQDALPIGTQIPEDVLAMIKDPRQPSELSGAELKSRLRTGRNYMKSGNPPQDVRARVAKIMKATREEQTRRGGNDNENANGQATTDSSGGGQQANAGTGNDEQQTQSGGTNTDNGQVQQLDGNQGNPDAEAKARALLNNPNKAEDLSNRELNQRLRDMRDLLAGNQLSRDTERALRSKLQAERAVLRARVAGNGQSGAGGNNNVKPGNTTVNITVILADNRDANLLDDAALHIRIDVLRDAVINVRYSEQERQRWRRMMERDRLILRERLIAQRRQRAARLKHDNININIGINFQPDRPPPRDVFAAEVGDAELETVLLAPPRRKIERRYTVEEIESSPEIRDALPRIEIDTIHFGFGESFVREEEVENLDRIAEIMEKILAAHPREVFMIEGHTDAVGSDAFNLNLSRQRALAIKEALTTYYVIPPENLKTLGYGERFLKIPTAEAEAENRRVSIARATSLLGEAEQ